MEDPTLKNGAGAGTARGIARWVGQMLGGVVLYGALLFLFAGRLNWTAGWAFLGVNTLIQVLSAVVLIPRQPGLIADRSMASQGTKSWDRYFVLGILLFGTLGIAATAGLDARFGLSATVGREMWIFGLVLVLGSGLFTLWAMASNPFFTTTVRIQRERGHSVVNSGPYYLVRHPGYLGSLFFNLAAPLALDSLLTYLPALITIVLIFVRTRFEDRTLMVELQGYRDYASVVIYRLIPGVW